MQGDSAICVNSKKKVSGKRENKKKEKKLKKVVRCNKDKQRIDA
jgi:hypothetical protein